MKATRTESEGSPGPLGPFFDALSRDHGFEVSFRERQNALRLLEVEGLVRDVRALRAALASVLARDPERRRRFLGHFDGMFMHSLRAEGEPSVIVESNALARWRRWLAKKAAQTGVSDLQEERVVPPEREAPPKPAEKPLRFSPLVRPAPDLVKERPIPWPSRAEIDEARRRASAGWVWAPKWGIDPKRIEEKSFRLSAVGCRDRRLLDDATLDEVADGMAYFGTGVVTEALEAEETVRATIEAGIPELRFRPGKEVRRVLLLEDEAGPREDWNTVPRELAEGLRQRGVRVVHGTFHEVPETFRTEEGERWWMDGIEGNREGWLVLLASRGDTWLAPRNRPVIEDLRHWPLLARLDPRERRFWSRAAVQAGGIPVYEASPAGLRAMVREILGERGEEAVREIPGEATHLDAILGEEAVAWAAACAFLPCFPLGIAESLRRAFFSGDAGSCGSVPAHAVGRLFRIPGQSWNGQVLEFRRDMRDELLRRAGWLFEPARRQAIRQHCVALFEDLEAELGEFPFARAVCRLHILWLRLQNPAMPQSEATRCVEDLELLTAEGSPLRAYFRYEVAGRSGPMEDMAPLAEEDRSILQGLVPAPIGGGASNRDAGSADRAIPEDMVPIPGGRFRMGDPTGEGEGAERPARQVEVSEFAIGRYPVTNGQWKEVWVWGTEHGYDLEKRGEPGREEHPVVEVTWYDAVKWCNARSEKEGRRPVYYEDAEYEQVYRSGEKNLETGWVDWEADGYRLPTEAEWEKAARGGLEGHHYPWESKGKGYEGFIHPWKANYDKSGKGGTTPVRQYAPNGYGLYDMAGNVWEWCWDCWDEAWYRRDAAETPDTRGPGSGARRVYRGGGWAARAGRLRCSSRGGSALSARLEHLGFRPSLGRWGLGRESGESGARRDDERSERRRVSEARAMGCLIVRVAAVEGVRVWGRGPGGERELKAGEGELVEAGPWALRCEAAGYESTRGEVEIRVGEAKEVGMALERGVPEGFVWIPGGEFAMGDPWEEGWKDERPVHRVWVSEVWMDRYAMTNGQWREVRAWAVENGYELEVEGDPAKGEHPVVDVSWYDAVKWCNARSEKEGRRPVYYLDEDHGEVYRKGEKDVEAGWADWGADGYRLPTEAEWEKAARGGLEGHHYPWESKGKGYEGYIEPGKANYEKSGKGGTRPVGQYDPNGYGLYDMAGNVWEWCWDCWDDTWYQRDEAKASDTRGPESGAFRVHRGGCWAVLARGLRCSCRSGDRPSSRLDFLGFRPSLGRLGRAEPAEGGGEARRDDEPSRRPTSGGAGPG